MNKRLFSMLALLLMAATGAWAQTTLTTETTTWENGDYVVPAEGVTIDGHITVNGTVNLTLTEGATLTANTGITLSDGATLNVSGDGAMAVNGSNNNANSTIAGTGEFVLKSGTLTVKGGNGAGVGDQSIRTDNRAKVGGNAINGNVTVSGGTLIATGGNGGGVGAYSAYSYGAVGGVAISGNVSITSGTVTATGGNGGSIGEYGAYEYGGAGAAAINGNVNLTGGALTCKEGTHGVNGDGQGGAGGTSYSGTLTLGAGVTLYEGTDNTGTVLDENTGSSREYTGDKKANMYAYGVVKSALNDAIADAETLYESIKNSKPEKAAALLIGINAAKEVRDNADATQEDVDNALNALNDAIETANAIDKSALNDAITDAETLYESIKDSEPEKAAALLIGINAAKEVMENADATQEDVDNALNALNEIVDITTAIAETTFSNAQILGSSKRIIINNAANANVAVYDAMGRTIVKEQRLNSNNEVFAMPQTGIYVVRLGNTAKKVLVK